MNFEAAKQFILRNCRVSLYEMYKNTPNPEHFLWEDVAKIQMYTDPNPECAICLECPMYPQITDCGHFFCAPCILAVFLNAGAEWVHCPMCRSNTIAKFHLKSLDFHFIAKPTIDQEIDFHLMVKNPFNTHIQFAHKPSLLYQRELPYAHHEVAKFHPISILSNKAVHQNFKQSIAHLKRNFPLSRRIQTQHFLDSEHSDFSFKSRTHDPFAPTNYRNYPTTEKYNLVYHNTTSKSKLIFQSPIYPNTFLNVVQQQTLLACDPHKIPYRVSGKIINIKEVIINKALHPDTFFECVQDGLCILILTVNITQTTTTNTLHHNSDLQIHFRELVQKDVEWDVIKTRIALTQQQRQITVNRQPTVITHMSRNTLFSRPPSPLSPTPSLIADGYNTCMFGIECQDPDISFAHDISCPHFSLELPTQDDGASFSSRGRYVGNTNTHTASTHNITSNNNSITINNSLSSSHHQ